MKRILAAATLGAALTLAAGAASAATCTDSTTSGACSLSAGQSLTFNPAVSYNYYELVDTNAPATRKFTFSFAQNLTADAAAVDLSTGASGLVNGMLSWLDGSGNTLASTKIGTGDKDLLLPVKSGDVRAVQLAWQGISKPVNLTLQVTSPVPIPASGVLLLGALGALGLAARRKRQARAAA